MNEYIIGLIGALWAGVLTSISPCPLATNIAAISFLGRKISSTSYIAISGILYALGRMVAYLFVGAVVTSGFLAVPTVSFFLQKYINIILGPILIIVGMFLLELFNFNFSTGKLFESIQKRMTTTGWPGNVPGSLLLGFIFALAFCPISATLFFGILLPLSLKINSPVLSPLVYGFGTALPVLAVVIVLTLGEKYIGTFFTRITTFEKWVRLIGGVIILTVGIYLCVNQILTYRVNS